jgi:GMP synthase (glutamine-hydrolysing)
MGPTVLLIAHSERRDNRVAALLAAKGCALDWRCPKDGDALPRDWSRYCGAVAFGGPQSANDAPGTAYLQAEIDWIGDYLGAGRPFLGICLGAQLMARSLGAEVTRHPQDMLEVGYYPISPTAAGQRLFPAAMHVYHWHREGFALPTGAELLATGECFVNQAFRYGTASYGLQFHPEVTSEIMRHWVSHDDSVEDLVRPGAQSAELQLAGGEQHDPTLGSWTSRFLDHWLEVSGAAGLSAADQRGAA